MRATITWLRQQRILLRAEARMVSHRLTLKPNPYPNPYPYPIPNPNPNPNPSPSPNPNPGELLLRPAFEAVRVEHLFANTGNERTLLARRK